MPWADFACVDWEDCIWQDWADCEWDKFSIVYQDAKTRTMKQLPPEGVGNLRRPYLEGNPSYVEDNLRYPDAAMANARIKANREVRPHMTFKQPYRYDEFQKMKHRDEPAFPHHETMSAQNMVETPMDIVAEEIPEENEWQWLRYLDDSRWTPIKGGWFDNRWINPAFVPAISWDSDNSDDEIDQSEEDVPIAVSGGGAPYDWAVSGTGFTLGAAQTSGVTNTLNASASACGNAEITVTDPSGEDTTGYVRCTDASRWVLVYSCGAFSPTCYCVVEEGKFQHIAYFSIHGSCIQCLCDDACAQLAIAYGDCCCVGCIGNLIYTLPPCGATTRQRRIGYKRYEWQCS